MTSQRRDGEDQITVDTYRPSEYAEAVWQVVSDTSVSHNFVAAEFKQVSEAEHPIDTMFSDFGNISGTTIELSREAGDFDLQQVQDPVFYQDGPECWEVSVQLGEVIDEPTKRSARGSASGATQESEISQNSEGNFVGARGVTSQAEGADADQKIDDGASQAEMAAQFDEEKVREALEQAYEQGCADVRQEVVKIQQQLEERYRLLWEDMQIQLDEALHTNEVKAVELALQVAKRLVGEVVDTKRDYIVGVVQEAIKLSAGAQIASVRVGSQDFEFLNLQGYGDKTKTIAGEHLSFVSDDSIRAGCVLVTSAGEVDFDLGKAWERIRAKVLQEPEA